MLYVSISTATCCSSFAVCNYLRCGAARNRELDNALRLTDTGAETLADARTGKNGRHRLAGLLR